MKGWRGGAAAIAVLAWATQAAVTGQQAGTPAEGGTGSVATPRAADGKPDLSGLWIAPFQGFGAATDESGNVFVTIRGRGDNAINFERDSGIMQRADPNRPIYKPEFWAKVRHLDENGNTEDPTFRCMPSGVPRMGPPAKIMQSASEVVFLYQRYPEGNSYRVIPTDGRPHHPELSLDQTWLGDSVGRWEGDTLVIDTIGFNDISWLGWPGYFHSSSLRVIERLRREGNTLTYEATVEDPEVLERPWVMTPHALRLTTDSGARLLEEPPCVERDVDHLVTKERG
jgi:hypothetical protein